MENGSSCCRVSGLFEPASTRLLLKCFRPSSSSSVLHNISCVFRPADTCLRPQQVAELVQDPRTEESQSTPVPILHCSSSGSTTTFRSGLHFVCPSAHQRVPLSLLGGHAGCRPWLTAAILPSPSSPSTTKVTTLPQDKTADNCPTRPPHSLRFPVSHLLGHSLSSRHPPSKNTICETGRGPTKTFITRSFDTLPARVQRGRSNTRSILSSKLDC